MTFSKNKILPPVLFLAIAALLFGTVIYRRAAPAEPISLSGFKLNTVVTITIYDSQDQELLKQCMELCDQYEEMLSRTIETSEVSRLNRGELADENGVSVLSSDLYNLLRDGQHFSQLSDGAFDLTIGAVSSLWDFTSEDRHAPSPDAVEEALPKVGWEQVELLGGNSIRMPEGVIIDPGAIAKGYIADRLKEYLLSQGVESATINLGGNVLCIGSRPDGTPFRIGVQKPFAERNETAAILQIEGRSVVSSGIYERYFEEDGVFYHHILDPDTGYPCENGLRSVTIISDTSTEGDALSTACFALGIEKGMAFIESLEGVEAVFIDEAGQLTFSGGFTTPYELTDG